MIVKTARGHGGRKVFYDRKVSPTNGSRTRQYHAFGLALVVSGTGESFWRFIVGKWVFVFGYKDRRAQSGASLLKNNSTALANVDEPVPAIAERADEIDAKAIDAGLNQIGGDVVAALDAQPVHDRSPELDQTSIGKEVKL